MAHAASFILKKTAKQPRTSAKNYAFCIARACATGNQRREGVTHAPALCLAPRARLWHQIMPRDCWERLWRTRRRITLWKKPYLPEHK